MSRAVAGERSAWALGLTLAVGLLAAAPLRAAEPVEDLRQALTAEENRLPETRAQRRENLQKAVDALKTVGQLRRALVLETWYDDPGLQEVDKDIRRIDAELRAVVATRLTKALEVQARLGDPTSKLAVANVISEMGPTVRALTPEDKKGFARSLTPIVIELTKDPDVGVRQEALRALGNINPKADEAGRVFAEVLANDPAPGPRLAAGDGLGQMVRVASQLYKPTTISGPVIAVHTDVTDALGEAATRAPMGLRDADPAVRSASAETLYVTAAALADLLPEGEGRRVGAPGPRPMGAKEQAETKLRLAQLQRELDELRPVLTAFRAQGGLLAALLSDPAPRVRKAAAETLVKLAVTRQRLLSRLPGTPLPGEGDAPPAAAGLDPLEPFLEKQLGSIAPLLSDPDRSQRVHGARFLTLIEDRALPMLRVLVTGLGDSDRFVRWNCIKAIGNLPADRVSAAVPALAQLLSDSDVSIREGAAAALEGMGKHAAAAAAALAQSAANGDPEPRIAAMHALRAIGSDAVAIALPKLIDVLGQADADTKVLVATAETLAEAGPAARAAIPALRRLIGHDESEVRTAASEAILAINTQVRR